MRRGAFGFALGGAILLARTTVLQLSGALGDAGSAEHRAILQWIRGGGR